MELTKIQSRAMEEIYSYYNPNNRTKVDFKAPTGSGKTIIATWLISSILERNINDKFIFVIATPSTSSLPFFFEQKINQYKKDLPFSKFDVEYIESPSSSVKIPHNDSTPKISLVKNKVYIFGKATFGSGRIFTEQHVIDDFIQNACEQNYKIIYIRDEAHIGDLKSDEDCKNFEKLLSENAHFILKMTATPNYTDQTVNIVTIKESDLKDGNLNEGKWLLKTNPVVLVDKNMTEDELLTNSIEKFLEIKNKYLELEKTGVVINPAMLIQVGSEPQDKDKKEEFKKYIEKIKNTLNYYSIPWVSYFGDNDKDSNTSYKKNFTLDNVTNGSSGIDAIIFKIGPSTGWDIPRACMLLQLRKVCSDKLNTQTVGRIKRNPYPNLEKNDITDNYYIFSNHDRINDDIIFYRYNVRDKHKTYMFPYLSISNDRVISVDNSINDIEKNVSEYISNNRDFILQEIRNVFVKKNGEDVFINEYYQVNGNIIFSSITNPFIFLKILNRLKNTKKLIYNICKSVIQKSYIEYFSDQNIYENIKLKIEHLEYIMLSRHSNDINKMLNNKINTEIDYKLDLSVYKPDKFVEFSESGRNEISFSDDYYMFNICKNNVKNVNDIQPLDSNTERYVFEVLKQDIYGINQYLGNKIKVWFKNKPDSSIFAQYLDEDNNIKSSFFDFIVQFSNGINLFIEVKNTEDIDPKKTAILKKSYEYIFNKHLDNFTSTPVVLCLWEVNTQTNMIYTNSYYDKELIKADLKNKTAQDILRILAML